MNADSINYWDKFYTDEDHRSPMHPTQFAAFVLGEANNATRLIEIGCGNGRDSDFFASHGLTVTALDASVGAIELCKRRLPNRNIDFFKFELGQDDIDFFEADEKNKRIHETGNIVLYARFFLHAITEEDECVFLSFSKKLLKAGSMIALEYRCSGDEVYKKEFGQHFRRYIKHEEICDKISKYGFQITYQITGRGFAKYKAEDALVGRCIAIRK